ncbi:MAG: UbiA family prenyltransferase [Promethearchaeota archaeon]
MWYDYIKVCRPLNCILTTLAVVVGGVANPGSQNAFLMESSSLLALQNLIIGAIAAGLIAAGGYVINDYYDVEIDKINNPSRPIARGAISLSNARKYSFLLFGSGIILCSLTFNALAILTCLCATYLLYRYSADLKTSGFVGNLIVACLSFILFFYGGVLIASPTSAVFPASFAFLIILAREIVKDVEDITGDKENKCLTLPIRYGVSKSIFVAKSILSMLAIFSMIPYVLGVYSSVLYPVFILVNDSFLAIVLVYLSWKPEADLIIAATPSKQILKLCMVLGTIGFFISTLIPIF